MQDFKKLCCTTILDLTVMLQHTSVSNCFYYMIVWYVLSIYAESNTHNYKPITAGGGGAFTSESTIRHAYSNREFWWGG